MMGSRWWDTVTQLMMGRKWKSKAGREPTSNTIPGPMAKSLTFSPYEQAPPSPSNPVLRTGLWPHGCCEDDIIQIKREQEGQLMPSFAL